MDGGDKAVASAGQSLDETGASGRVAEGFADAVDSGVEAVFVIDKGAVRPDCLRDFFASKDFAGALEEHEEDLEGLGVELDPDSLLAKFSGGRVRLEDSKAIAR